MSELDRGLLAKIDRRLLAGLGRDEVWQMVRVPAAEALWSAWKRYCDSLGVSMGRGIAVLIQGELRSVVDGPDEIAALLGEREAELAKRERRLEEKERSVDAREQHVRAVTERPPRLVPPTPGRLVKVGRNDPCPCGSGIKYKGCHASGCATERCVRTHCE